ncbi:1,2-dihydroxy-3-keto-5-methylthiopentene dioxygenase [Mycena sanguinolenta]|uniref:1,2-dihydroxy-3-keto-5-methylthiopentene dioxygenase n=1 Tax=Mycena sanguinolenta TaxID=230812 RepID=A0A8H7CZR7_9AGAR|nr:1,2-dihydroxy-3-keto-5-methylthiopentene dioxygenase [Mycena sanguinolenta]
MRVETPTDAWIRIAVAPRILFVLPAGIYHRFTLDTKDQIRALSLFNFLRLASSSLFVSFPSPRDFEYLSLRFVVVAAFPRCRLLAAPCSGSTQCGARSDARTHIRLRGGAPFPPSPLASRIAAFRTLLLPL